MNPDAINALGRRVGLCQRRRLITPWHLAVSLLAGCATQRLDCLADAQRLCNALFDLALSYKPFHKQLAKPAFADFMRALADQLLDRWRVQVLQAEPGGVFDAFDRIVIQDGSSFALKSALAEVYPGRFHTQAPAAVELHTTLDLFDGTPSRIGLTPDTDPERDALPAPEALARCLLLADRGYFKRDYLAALDQAEAFFVVRSATSINPRVIQAFDGQGQRRPRLDGRLFKAVRQAPHRVLDLDVCWGPASQAWHTRLIVSGRPDQRQPLMLVTNLARSRYSATQVQQAYRLRWQIELLFKEYKSYAHLQSFDTAHPAIAEGLIWAAVATATLQRFMAHTTQRVHGVEISSQKAAKAADPVLFDLFQALAANRARRCRQAFAAVLNYLATNARRAHPKRDRRSGRMQLGLQAVDVEA
ncbi:IS4 family transposase [Salinisphaera sp. RV14]|uniref:IS4 family transposase n=1 Tax=Salinisphaera sp. RV14 TaxID=3454140 RepID=UPI003F847F89